MTNPHPLIRAALRAHRGETSERFGVSASEVAAMHHAVLAVLRELAETPTDGCRYNPMTEECGREWLYTIIKEIEG